MFLTISRLMVVLMAGVLCFTLLVPLALKNHQPWLAAGVGAVFAAYLLANVILWRRMKPRA
jgi:uncharacterized membrane protein